MDIGPAVRGNISGNFQKVEKYILYSFHAFHNGSIRSKVRKLPIYIRIQIRIYKENIVGIYLGTFPNMAGQTSISGSIFLQCKIFYLMDSP